jgi:ABC-2 type transport system ATP-binding protein
MSRDLAVETAALTKDYSTRWKRRLIRAVDGISLKVARGTTFGLLGPNGAGKTTFVKMLLSVVHPTSGSAAVFGRSVQDAEARRPIGYLPENHRFPTYLTGAGMLDLYASLSGVEAAKRKRLIPELLDQVGLHDWAGVRLGKYSKGMLQRVGLAQALIHSPSLLILDEPSDGVDPVGRRHIRELLSELEAKGVTIFINSHLLVEVELFCREVAILHKGKVALEGKIKDLTAGKGYRLTALQVPDALRGELGGRPAGAGVEFMFASRQEANRAVDLLRAQQCEIESFIPTTSSLEEIFVKTVESA